jgi:hypothetical protein
LGRADPTLVNLSALLNLVEVHAVVLVTTAGDDSRLGWVNYPEGLAYSGTEFRSLIAFYIQSRALRSWVDPNVSTIAINGPHRFRQITPHPRARKRFSDVIGQFRRFVCEAPRFLCLAMEHFVTLDVTIPRVGPLNPL